MEKILIKNNMKKDKRIAIIKDPNAHISMSLIQESIIDYFEQTGVLPKVIYVAIHQYLDFPSLFINYKEGEKEKYMGIKLEPVQMVKLNKYKYENQKAKENN